MGTPNPPVNVTKGGVIRVLRSVGDRPIAVALEELEVLLAQTSRWNAEPAKAHADADKFWSETVRRGQALMQLSRDKQTIRVR